MNFEAFIRSGQFWTGTWNELEVAQHHGLLGPWAPRDRLLALHTRYARLLELTAKLSASLSCPHVVLKGVTAGAAWEQPPLRPQSDIDVLVEDQRAAVEAWTRDGLINPPTSLETSHFHLTLSSPLFPGVPIELHDALSSDFAMKLDVNALLSKRVTLNIDGHSIPALSDDVAYLALHAATHAGVKLRWFFDLREKCRQPVNWGAVVAQALAWNVPWPIWWALREAKTRVGADVPSSVLAALEPPLTARARIQLARGNERALRLSLTPVSTLPGIIASKMLSARTRRR